VITYPHAGAPIVLEDPYVLAGIPLHLGCGRCPRVHSHACPGWRVATGVFALELLAGIRFATFALCVDRGYTVSPAREPLGVDRAHVASRQFVWLPLPLWMMLDPA